MRLRHPLAPKTSGRVMPLLLCCLALASAACANKQRGAEPQLGQDALGARSDEDTPRPQLSGTVFYLERRPGVPVTLVGVDAGDGHRLGVVATTSTDADGRFQLDPGSYEGPAVLEARLSAPELTLSLPLEKLTLGEPLPPVALTPVTSLMTSYSAYLASKADAWEASVSAARAALHAHFLGIDHVHTIPADWPLEAGQDAGPCQLASAEVKASLLCQSLATLGATKLSPGAQALTPAEGLAQLLWALQDDLRATGRLDGQSASAQRPSAAAYARLGTEAARDALIDAMASFLEGPHNHGGCSAEQVQPLMAHLRTSVHLPLAYREAPPEASKASEVSEVSEPLEASELAGAAEPSGVSGLADASELAAASETSDAAEPPAPPEVHCSLYDASDAQRSFAETVRGKVRVDCAWQSEAGLRDFGLDAQSGLPWMRQIEATAPNTTSVCVDTEAVEKANGVYAVILSLRGEDTAGQVTRERVTVQFRNAAPKVQVGAFVGGVGRSHDPQRVYYEAGKAFALPLEVDSAARAVRLYVDGQLVHEDKLTPPTEASTALVPVTLRTRLEACDQTAQLRVVVVDAAGNETQRAFGATCLSEAPKIVPVDASFVADYPADQAPMQQGWDGVRPPRLHKFFHRLDFDPAHGKTAVANNLPVVRFRVQDASAASLAPKYRVSYSYHHARTDTTNTFPLDQPSSDWQPLEPAGPDTFELPLSYQTLLPRSVWHGDPERARRLNFIAASRPTDLHQVRFRVENEAGGVDEKTYVFALDLRGPPLEVRDVGFTSDVLASNYDVALNHMRAARRGLAFAEVAWDLGWTEHSLFLPLEVEVAAEMDLEVFSERERIDQWDRGDCGRGDGCAYEPWPPTECRETQHLYSGDRARNTAWSASRGCHPPVEDHYPKDGRTRRLVTNAVNHAHSAEFIAPRRWLSARSAEARTRVGRDRAARLVFKFPVEEKAAKNWQLSRGREGVFQAYHVHSEDDFHFRTSPRGRGVMHVHTTDYYVQQFAAEVQLVEPQSLVVTRVDPRFPGPLNPQLSVSRASARHRWGADEGKSWPRSATWHPSQFPHYRHPGEVGVINPL